MMKKTISLIVSVVLLISMLSIGSIVSAATAETIDLDPRILSLNNTGDGSKNNPYLVKPGLKNIPLTAYTTTDRDWVALYPSSVTANDAYSTYIYLKDTAVVTDSGNRVGSGGTKLSWPLPAGGSYCLKLFENDGYQINKELYFKVASAPSVTLSAETVSKGRSLNVLFDDVDVAATPSLYFSVYKGRANGALDTWTSSIGPTAVVSGSSYTKTATINTAALGTGYYVAALHRVTAGGQNPQVIASALFEVTEAQTLQNAWYVNTASGSDSNDGKTVNTALKSLPAAISKANASNVKTIAIVGTCDGYTAALATPTAPITITGYNESSVLNITYRIDMSGPVTFENLTIKGNGNKILTNGHNVVFGKGLNVSGTEVYVGFENKNVSGASNVTFESGNYNSITIGTYYNTARRTMAGANVYVGEGVTVSTFQIGSSVDSTRKAGTDFTENVTIVMNGTVTGTIYDSKLGDTGLANFRITHTANPRFKKGFQLIYNNNRGNRYMSDHMMTAVYDEATITALGGTWILKAGADIYLSATDTLGTYTVNDGKTVVATDKNGVKYRSYNGKLVVPAGVYAVQPLTNGTAVPYNHYGDRIEVYENNTGIDLNGVTPPTVSGKAFVGWNGAKANGIYAAGDVLTAQFVNYSGEVGGDFSVVGVQMRTEGVQGLRFIVEQSNTFTTALGTQLKALYGENTTLKQTAFGALAIPSAVLDANEWAELKKGATYTYNGTPYTPAVVAAENIYRYGDGFKQYTICITDINTAEHYKRQYTVRGYVEYTLTYADGTTDSIVVYTEEYSTNLVAVAEAAIGVANTADIPVLKDVIATAKADTKTTYESSKTSVSYRSGAKTPPNSTKLYTNSGGLTVRDIVIDVDGNSANNVAANATTIIQLSDTHIYRLNEQDWLNSTLVGQHFFRADAGIVARKNLTGIRKALDYAMIADQIVISGDVIDELQQGALEVVQKEIIAKYPQVLLLNGNHDVVQQAGTFVGEVYDEATRYQMLNEAWASTYAYTTNGVGGVGDVTYASKIVNDSVMVIQMDNGTRAASVGSNGTNYNLYSFRDGTAAKLQADLTTARSKGYTVLLFTHVPLTTGNSSESAVAAYYSVGGNPLVEDFYLNSNNELTGGPNANQATKDVMKVITSNGDIIKGVYNGHYHDDYYTEIVAGSTKIPQYTVNATANGGQTTKITVYGGKTAMTLASGQNGTVSAGSTINFSLSNVKTTVEFGLLKCDENGELNADSYQNLYGYRQLSAGTTQVSVNTGTLGMPKGNYVAGIWTSGWNFIVKIPIIVQ